MKNNVYLIPHHDAAYQACIASQPPTEDAIFLVAEGTYPVEYYYNRNDSNGCTLTEINECSDRESLIEALNGHGELYHRIRSLWDFEYYETDNEDTYNKEVCELFDNTYYKLIEMIDLAYEQMLDEMDENNYDFEEFPI